MSAQNVAALLSSITPLIVLIVRWVIKRLVQETIDRTERIESDVEAIAIKLAKMHQLESKILREIKEMQRK